MSDILSKKIIFFLIAIQLLLIIFVFFQLKSNYPFFMYPPPGTDMLTRIKEANSLLKGNFPGNSPYMHVFFYIYILAGIFIISMRDIFLARFIQSLSLLFITYFTYRIAKMIFGKKTGLLAAILSILYFPYYAYSYFFIDTIIQTLLMIASLFILLSIRNKPSMIKLFLAGLIVSSFILIRPNTLIMFPVFIYILFPKIEKKNIFNVLCFLFFSSFLIILPMIRNYAVSGHFKLIVGSSSTLWIGNNEMANGSMFFGDNRNAIREKVKKNGNGEYLKDIINFATTKPRKFIFLQLKKLYLFFDSYEIPNNLNLFEIRKGSYILKIIPLGFSLIGPLFFMGLFIYFYSEKHSTEATFLLWSLFLYIIAVCIFFVISRFRMPAIPLFIIFSAYALENVYRFFKENVNKRILIIIVFIASYSLVNFSTISSFIMRFKPSKTIETVNGKLAIDDNNIWRSRKIVKLRKGIKAKKDIKITRKTPYLFLQICYIAKEAQNTFEVEINDKKEILKNANVKVLFEEGSNQYLVSFLSLPNELIKHGVNSFIIHGKKNISLPYDDSVNLGRSAVIDTKNHFKNIDGEFMIRLLLSKTPAPE